jgi:hypothetical protein
MAFILEGELKEKERALIQYTEENFTIENLGSGKGVKTFKALCEEIRAFYDRKEITKEELDSLKNVDVDFKTKGFHKPGLIQIRDCGEELHKYLDSNTLLLYQLIGSMYHPMNAYENGIHNPRSSPWYWEFTLHFDFDLDILNEHFEGENKNFTKYFSPFEAAFLQATFMSYLNTLGYPNGIDNWDNEEIFRRDYLLFHDSSYLLGRGSQLERYLDEERYLAPSERNKERDRNKRRKLSALVQKILNP